MKNIIVIVLIIIITAFLTWITILRFNNYGVLKRECTTTLESSATKLSSTITYTYKNNEVLEYKMVSKTVFSTKERFDLAKQNDEFLGDPYIEEFGKSGYYKSTNTYKNLSKETVTEINFGKINLKKMKDIANTRIDFWYDVVKDGKVEPKELEKSVFYTCRDK